MAKFFILRRMAQLCLLAVLAACSSGQQDKFKAAEMVTIPAGHFTMGSSKEEVARLKLTGEASVPEQPQHEVVVHSFAMGKYMVTRGEFAEFVRETGYAAPGCHIFDGKKYDLNPSADWQHPGADQTDRDPVVCVSYPDVLAYIQWYSRKTGHDYRLPSEAEWEYAARVGTATAWPWGEDTSVQCRYANGYDLSAKDGFSTLWPAVSCRDGYVFTSPVGSFQPNALGLYDMQGNAWRWTGDCWTANYNAARSDSVADTSGDCSKRVVRGGSWYFGARSLRSAFRFGNIADNRVSDIGFRLAMTLP